MLKWFWVDAGKNIVSLENMAGCVSLFGSALPSLFIISSIMCIEDVFFVHFPHLAVLVF